MIVYNNYNEIKEGKILPSLNEMFKIEKGNRKEIYKIKESANFEGCYDLFRCVNNGYHSAHYIWTENHIGGSNSIIKCVSSAYDAT